MRGQDDKKSNDRNRFYFYYEWADNIADEPDDVRLEVFDAAIYYSRTGELPKLSPVAKMALKFIKTYMDRDRGLYDIRCEAGKKKKEKGEETTPAHSSSDSQRRLKDEVNANLDNIDTAISEQQEHDRKARECQENLYTHDEMETTERPVTEEEVYEYMHTYARDKGISVDVRDEARKFMDYYDANGWLTARREPIRDWRAVVRNWFNKMTTWNHGNDKQEQSRLENERELAEARRRFDERERYKREHGEEDLPY